MQFREDEVVNAIRWRLGIPSDSDVARAKQIWEWLHSSADSADRAKLDRAGKFLAGILEKVVRARLNLPLNPPAEDAELLNSLWNAFANWLKAEEIKRSPRVSGLIREAISPRGPHTALDPNRASRQAHMPPPRGNASSFPRTSGSTPAKTPGSTPARTTGPAPAATPHPGVYIPPAATRPPAPAPAAPVPPVDTAVSANAPLPVSDSPAPRPVAPQWLYRPVPDREPDPHKESDSDSRSYPTGEVLFAARVRGKKHKHEGTNCDDWFEVRTNGRWTVIAVADGAGSRKFSRLGAKASCIQAAEMLSLALANYQIPDRPNSDGLVEKDENKASFLDPAVEQVQQEIVSAIAAAAAAVEAEAQMHVGDTAYESLLGRPIRADDLAATFLVVAHTTLKVGETEQSFAIGCQIGDGAIAAVDTQGAVRLLGTADSGEYSGETDFLTSPRQRDPANLRRKTMAVVGDFRALFVMTDGVADDYFPADPAIAQLYADLVLNGILTVSDADSAVDSLLEFGRAAPPFDPTDGRINCEAETPTQDGLVRVVLRSAATYASELGVTGPSLAVMTECLRQGARNTPLAQRTDNPAERLRWWLDSYQVRGSFDDRTLVVLQCERPA